MMSPGWLDSPPPYAGLTRPAEGRPTMAQELMEHNKELTSYLVQSPDEKVGFWPGIAC